MNKTEILQTKEELLDKKVELENDLRSLEKKLETINYNEEDEIKRKDSVKNKTKLSELTRNDRIFKISYWKGEATCNWIGYVDVTLCEPHKDGGYNFSVSHKTEPQGFSSWFSEKDKDKNFVLMDFGSSLFFLTMKPKTWEEDMKLSMEEYVKTKRENFNKEIKLLKKHNKKMIDSYKKMI